MNFIIKEFYIDFLIYFVIISKNIQLIKDYNMCVRRYFNPPKKEFFEWYHITLFVSTINEDRTLRLFYDSYMILAHIDNKLQEVIFTLFFKICSNALY